MKSASTGNVVCTRHSSAAPRAAALLVLVLMCGCGGGTSSSPASPPPPPPFQARPFPGDYFMRQPTVGGDGPIPSEAYDLALKELFISDPNFNSVEVYSTVNGQFVGAIPIPGPAGLSFSPDFSSLFVGTITPNIYRIDPVALHVTAQIQIPASVLTTNQLGTTLMPVMPIAMADGTLLIGMGSNGESASSATTQVVHLIRYQPNSGTFTPIDQGGLAANPARSGNGEFVAVSGLGSSGLELLVYSAAIQGYLPNSVELQNVGVFLAANADGSQFASVQEVIAPGTGSFNSQVNFWGPNLQAGAQFAVDGTVSSAIFSRDGTNLYLMTDFSYLVAIGTQSGMPTGYQGLAIGSLPLPTPPFYDIDETNHLFGAAPGGAFVLNAAQMQSSPPTAMPIFTEPDAEANPNFGPLAGGTPVQFVPAPTGSGSADGIASSMEAYFGATPATQDVIAPFVSSSDGENALTATTPTATTPGTVTVVLTDASNNTVFLPDDFSYGPRILRIEPNVASIAGGDQLTLYAYGLSFVFPEQNVQVTVGGKPAAVAGPTETPVSFDYPEGALTVTIPPGTPGWADVVLTTSNGSDKLKRGIQYMKEEVHVAGGPLEYAVYDSVRNLFYLTGNGNSVAVFNPDTQTMGQPLQSASITASAVLQSEAMTPDGSSLLVADPTDQLVIVFDLAANTSKAVGVALATDPTSAVVAPRTIVTAAQNRAFVSVTPCVTNPVREINLTSFAVVARPDAASTCVPNTPYPEFGSGSGDGSTILYAGNSGNEPPGPEYIWRYDAASDAFSGPVLVEDLPWNAGEPAVDGDGGVIAVPQGVFDQRLLPLVPILQGSVDAHLNETGSLLYGAGIGSTGIVVSDTRNGRWVLMLAAQSSQGTVIAPDRPLAIDPSGGQIVLALQDGIAYFQLAVLPLAVGTVRPSAAAPGGAIQLNGSGFVSGTTATIGGQSATCTDVDSQTLSCTVPDLAAGSASITLTNPDGQTYSFENAFVVQ